jgi:hypothetical protein
MKTILNLSASVILIAFLWGIYWFSSFSLKTNGNYNHQYIPEKAVMAIRIDGKSIIDKGISSVILHEDTKILTLIDNLYKRRSGKADADQNVGIDYKSDLIIFVTYLNDHKLMGFLVNLKNKKKFDKNIRTFLEPNQSFSSSKNVGLIFAELPNKKMAPLTQTELKIQSDKILSQTSAFNVSEKLDFKSNETIVKTWSDNSDVNNKLVQKSEFSFTISDEAIGFNGTMNIDQIAKGSLNKRLSPSGIHFSTKYISQNISDSLSKFLKFLNLDSIDMTGISLNYAGTKIVEVPSLFIVPELDVLIQLKEPVDLKKHVLSLVDDKNLFFDVNNNYFKYGGEKYFIKQLSNTLIYIGVTEKIDLLDFTKNEFMKISGSLEPLTRLYGDGMIKKFIELIPIYSASKDLAKKIERIDLSIEGKESKFNANGIIKFKSTDLALNSIVQFALESQLVK